MMLVVTDDRETAEEWERDKLVYERDEARAEVERLRASWKHLPKTKITLFFYRFLKQIDYPICEKILHGESTLPDGWWFWPFQQFSRVIAAIGDHNFCF